MAHPNGGSRPLAEQSTAELVHLATDQISQLVRDELRLARVELASKGRKAGIGAGLFGGAAVLAGYGTAVLVAAAVLGLAEVFAGWLAALIVGAGLFMVAGLMVLIGRAQMKRAAPPLPERAVRSVRADLDALAAAVRDSRGKREVP
jgi:predicted phage tail protein